MPRPTPLGVHVPPARLSRAAANSTVNVDETLWTERVTWSSPRHVIKKSPRSPPSDRLPAKFAQTTLRWKSLRLNQRPFFFCSRAAFAHINKVRRSCSQIIKVGCERADEVRRQEVVPPPPPPPPPPPLLLLLRLPDWYKCVLQESTKNNYNIQLNSFFKLTGSEALWC